MKRVEGVTRSVRELLEKRKYVIDFYQRDYKWKPKEVEELVTDLTERFLDDYRPEHPRSQVEKYGHYFLGSIILSSKDSGTFIVDGQQRLTSLTLLLVHLHNLQQDRDEQVPVENLIYSERYGSKSFNIRVQTGLEDSTQDERYAVMNALFQEQEFDTAGQAESVQNMYARYHDIQELFPQELAGDALPYFIDWLTENVHLVEITASNDEDAYSIFETMNDRGLRLTPTDMLKGYLLANITDPKQRAAANTRWRSRIEELNRSGQDDNKEADADAIKIWLRSRYARDIRERKAGARPLDFDKIGTEFHRWVRDNDETLGLRHSDDFRRFIERDFDFYTRQYLHLQQASRELVPGLEHVLYNARHRFTQQFLLLLAPLEPDDSPQTITLKQRLVARYVDILLTRRIWNFRAIDYSTLQYNVFQTVKAIRGLAPEALAQKLYDLLQEQEAEGVTFANDRLRVHTQNRYAIHRTLARITDYVGMESGEPSRYLEYVRDGRNSFEVEHIWANHFEQHTDEFQHEADFAEHRNRIGGLVLLPKSFNASYGDKPYEEKVDHYFKHNLLVASLHVKSYENNPGFLKFVQRSGLPFQALSAFKKKDIEDRTALYQAVARRIWNPDDLLAEVKA
ncbi:DUF262 domain-containing protein [Deinococcus ficus]|uniref:DUF262 domain-containing protein n=1 Tax=Deinococcus ficus TaxID=317577 RepID=UPI00174917D1|nr:DUF262 domain-containing protein [Deinococcus ficus]GHF79839.1 hypothetical protein GCM10017782_17190 [Deinococcus ficus]